MPLIVDTERPILGYEGELFVSGLPFHDFSTNLTITKTKQTQQINTHGSGGDEQMCEVYRMSDATIASFHYPEDATAKAVVDAWEEGSYHDIVFAPRGFRVGSKARLIRQQAASHSVSAPSDGVHEVTLVGTAGGIDKKASIQSFDLNNDVLVTQASGAVLNQESYTGTDQQPVVAEGIVTGRGTDACAAVVWFSFQGVSGWTNLTGSTTAKLVWNDSTNDITIGISESFPINSTPRSGVATIYDLPSSDFGELGFELTLGTLPVGTSNYNLQLRTAISYMILT